MLDRRSPRFFAARTYRLRYVFLALLLLVVGFILIPTPIDPVSLSHPEDGGFTGVYAHNTRLEAACKISLDPSFADQHQYGPEDIQVTADGDLLTGLEAGGFVAMDTDGSNQRAIDYPAKGRPLGLAMTDTGDVLIADGELGLLRLPKGASKAIYELDAAAGQMLGVADDLDIAPDGVVYFSDAAGNYPLTDIHLTFFEGRGTGRLLSYDPKTKATRLLLDGLVFANGVAVSKAGDFVLVTDTARYRVHRVWLTGDKAGSSEILIDNLPGFPDGISRAPDGSFWIALYGPRSGLIDWLGGQVALKKHLAKLPRAVFEPGHRYGAIVRVDDTGAVIETLQDPSGEIIPSVTSVEQVGRQLWLGNLKENSLAVLDLDNPDKGCSR